ncbi:MAG: carbohydrate ABC transporter permease [Defluviitaleaceae bacterium]|nr:carbohydrate ABC transporter permease [Defluviitaleaceae bacterium]
MNTKTRRRLEIFDIFNHILMVLLIAVCILPIVFVFARATSSGQAINAGRVIFWPVDFNLYSFRSILDHPNFLVSYRNTILYTFLGTTFTMFITCLAAYPLSKMWLTGRKFFMFFFILTMFFNGGLIPNFVLITTLGMLNTMWALVVPLAFSQFFIILAMGSVQGLPAELEESAIMDGLNPWQTLFFIILPLIKPALATIALFASLNFWNDWFNAMIYLHSNTRFPVMLLLRNIMMGGDITAAHLDAGGGGPGSFLNVVSLRSAAIILVMLPITALYPFLQRFFVKGMLIGSIKG